MEQDFLYACRKFRAQEERDRQRNRLMTILAVSATIALVIAVFFGIQSNRSEQNANIALSTAQAASTKAVEQEAKAEASRAEAVAQQLVAQSKNQLNNQYDLGEPS